MAAGYSMAKLYVQRVFIMDQVEHLPNYLRLCGVLDTSALPLNVSRKIITLFQITCRNASCADLLDPWQKVSRKICCILERVCNN